MSFKKDDIVVRTGNGSVDPTGSMYMILGDNNKIRLISDGTERYPDDRNLRLATAEEVRAYKMGIRNINNTKKTDYYEIY